LVDVIEEEEYDDEEVELNGEEIGDGHYRHGHLPTADEQ
jgi:hypothetical protein